MSARLLLVARTVAHLRPAQFAGRMLRVARNVAGGPRLRHPPSTPRLTGGVADLAGPITARLTSDAFGPVLERARQLRDGTLHAVGQSMPVDEIQWTARPRSHLFSYHLHYFDDAPGLAALAHRGDAAAAERLHGLWQGWLSECAGARAGDGWDPYPIATRIPNWVQAMALITAAPSASAFPGDLRDQLLSSLWSQADGLRRTLEYDLCGNHLLRDRMALVWAAAALDPAPVDLRSAIDGWERELGRQLLADGMHEERTPAYHAQVLNDVLATIELLSAVDARLPPGIEDQAATMRDVLGRFVRRDGGLHPFGDTTPFGDPRPAAVERLASDVLGTPGRSAGSDGSLWHLEEAGYSGARHGDIEIVLDCGPFGPRHQPGHGHCDGLSFVLCLGDIPVVVDAGIAGYGDDPDRAHARGTAAHNTVQVDGREQSEIWNTFRVARRARPGPAGVTRDGAEIRLLGTIAPYHASRVEHRREIIVREGEVRVVDRVTGARGRRLDSRLHLAPGTVVEREDAMCWILRNGGRALRLEVLGVDEAQYETDRVYPSWGTAEHAPVLHAWISSCPENTHTFGFLLNVET